MSVVGGDAELGEDMTRTYTAAPVYNHGPAGLAHFLRDLDITDPGITEARHWRAPVFVPGRRRGHAWAAVGRTPPAPPAQAAAVTGEPGVTLESLDWEWGDAYIISYARDQWAALRRDTHRFLTAADPGRAGHQDRRRLRGIPVPRGCARPAPQITSTPRMKTTTWTRTGTRAGTGTGTGRGWGC